MVREDISVPIVIIGMIHCTSRHFFDLCDEEIQWMVPTVRTETESSALVTSDKKPIHHKSTVYTYVYGERREQRWLFFAGFVSDL
mmetsp:Transcript_2134/g.4324  ORF Transcript_2134/g.4324 Transcript_2134/m.4324 type:complete len:85 (+) Transcript_2134:1690-1944(+)